MQCDPEDLREVARGVHQTIDRAFLVAAGLRIACGEQLSADTRRAFEGVEREQPDPAQIAALPQRVDELVDLSPLTDAERKHLADAWAQLHRDGRHRISSRIRLVRAQGGEPTRDDDVEVSILPQSLEHGGAVVDLTALERQLAASASRRRLVFLIDRHGIVFTRMRALVAIAKRTGFAELGVLVEHEGIYRVLPMPLATAGRKAALDVFVDEDGIFLERGGEPHRTQRPPEVPLARPGAPLDDASRWDLDQLEQRFARSTFGASPRVRLSAGNEIWMRDVVAAAARVRGPQCAEEGGTKCYVAALEWAL